MYNIWVLVLSGQITELCYLLEMRKGEVRTVFRGQTILLQVNFKVILVTSLDPHH